MRAASNEKWRTLTRERACELLDYDPETGVFRWKVQRVWTHPVGSVAGNIIRKKHRVRYTVICIDQWNYLAHHLAWLITYGWLPDMIDHIDGDGLNNAISNLRTANKSLNAANAGLSAANTSGHMGIGQVRSGRWEARIKVNGRHKYLGRYRTVEEAKAAYRAARKIAFGEYAK